MQEVLHDAVQDSITAVLTTTTITTTLAIALSLATTPTASLLAFTRDGLPGQAEAGLVPKETRE